MSRPVRYIWFFTSPPRLNRKYVSTVKRIARQVRREVRIGLDRIIDRYYSIDTVISGSLPKALEFSRFADAYVNGPVSYWILRSYIPWEQIGPNDVFYDIGCGHGRVICMLARHRVAKCVGIELSREFAEKARVNAMTLRGRVSPIEVRVGDAAEMDYAEGTTFYFGDPFGADTMRAVLKRIAQSVQAKPRVTCIFVLPTTERSYQVRQAIESSGWLHFVGEQSVPFSPMRVEYWNWARSETETRRCLRTLSAVGALPW